jgi:hypothetical protein
MEDSWIGLLAYPHTPPPSLATKRGFGNAIGNETGNEMADLGNKPAHLVLQQPFACPLAVGLIPPGGYHNRHGQWG